MSRVLVGSHPDPSLSSPATMTQAAVLRALEPMTRGGLAMTMPDGSVRRFGDAAGARLTIRDRNFFRRCFFFGDVGFAESYMAGEWETDDIAGVISFFILNSGRGDSRAMRRVLNWLGWLNNALHRTRGNSESGSRANIAAHYDLSNDFFALFLDPSMTYSSALFRREGMTLAEAQIAKYERICELLELKPGDRVLETGGGWGAFSRYAARTHGCHVTTITLSRQQFEWADRLRREERLEDSIDLRLLDYRGVTGRFDKVVSIEMLEAVGHAYFDTYFAKCAAVLAPGGRMAVQVITCPESRCETMRRGVDFIQKHIFPGGEVPSVGCLAASISRASDLSLCDLFDFPESYARTLQMWAEAFESRLESVRALGFDEQFIRKWRYYFRYCEAGFRMRHISVVQMLLTRAGRS